MVVSRELARTMARAKIRTRVKFSRMRAQSTKRVLPAFKISLSLFLCIYLNNIILFSSGRLMLRRASSYAT